MFSNLSDFSVERSGKQALGFYIAYLFLFMLISAIMGGLYGGIVGNVSFETGARIGNVTAVILCLVLASMIIIKKQNSSFKTVFLLMLSGALAVFVGALGGLIPIAYLSTTPKNL